MNINQELEAVQHKLNRTQSRVRSFINNVALASTNDPKFANTDKEDALKSSQRSIDVAKDLHDFLVQFDTKLKATFANNDQK